MGAREVHEEETVLSLPGADLAGSLHVPEGASGVVLFAHGSGSSRYSARNRTVAEWLRDGGMGTLLMDLLTAQEERIDSQTREFRFDIPLLARRLDQARAWLRTHPAAGGLPVGYFGASTGAAAALIAAARPGAEVSAVVSRGGRVDLAEQVVDQVRAPTLLIVGGNDTPVIPLNQRIHDRLTCPKRLEIVPGADHLFTEPETLERVAELARDWFAEHLPRAAAA